MNLYLKNSHGRYHVATIVQVMRVADEIRQERCFPVGAVLCDPDGGRDAVRQAIGDFEREVFMVLWLDNRHRIIDFEEIAKGTVDGASVYPREVVKSCLGHNAAACIFAHNHPSGVAEPSQADRQITRRLQHALALIDVRVLDHFVVGRDEVVSFAERGWL